MPTNKTTTKTTKQPKFKITHRATHIAIDISLEKDPENIFSLEFIPETERLEINPLITSMGGYGKPTIQSLKAHLKAFDAIIKYIETNIMK